MKLLFVTLGLFVSLWSAAQETTMYTIVGVGDIMLGTDFPSKAYLPANNDCSPILSNVKSHLQNADITFGNLEGAFSDDAPVVKSCKNPDVCYAFRTPTKYFACLVEAGFDMFSLANNHSGDLGQRGRSSTIKLISDAGLHYAGLQTHPIDIFEKDGVKYGLAAFAPNSGTCNINDYAEVRRLINELKEKADIIIVSFHGGAEGAKHQHVTRKTETFYGENRGNVYQFARVAIDAGADVVFGHGPHVTRAVDLYKNKFIIYSMGNFATYSRVNLQGVSGLSPIVKVFVDKNGDFQKAQIISTYQQKGKGVFVDKQARVYGVIKSLTQQDIPEATLSFGDDGWITLKK